jgi:Na+/proline symporter
MSTGLNSMSGVLYEDFIRPGLNIKVSESKANVMMKLLCVAMGIFCVAMVFVVENLGGVLQVYTLIHKIMLSKGLKISQIV